MTPPPPSGLARLLQLASASLPVSGFAYSRGLETAVEGGWVRDADTAGAWVIGLLERQGAGVDVPVVLRLHRAWAAGDDAAVARWAALHEATRETAELRAEGRFVGESLARLAVALGAVTAAEVARERRSHLAMWALLGLRWGLDARLTAWALLWAGLEAQVQAAVKLVPLGQTDGQRLLGRGGDALGAVLARGEAVGDEEIGASAHGLAIASALHETQRTRLFRS
ncbi:MAG: urease accessory protein UreF [Myxococcales bacterium]|nr:urease accessory protein UreF [Myxococcales bacterium]MCB9734454.1 urease accessory protein UreF [Deltaproteobacteria bacterium]